MRTALVFLAFALMPVASHAETLAASLGVRTSDVNLSGTEASDVLISRFTRRMESICGSQQERGLQLAMVGPRVTERFAECKAQLRVAPDSNAVVRASFEAARAKFN